MCTLFRILSRVAFIPKWKDALLRTHFERCPRCGAKYGLERIPLDAYLRPGWIQRTPRLWPVIRRAIASGGTTGRAAFRRRPSLRPGARWRAAAAGAVALLLAGIGIARLAFHRPPAGPSAVSSPAGPAPVFRRILVTSQTLHGKPAKAHLYQTSNATYVWIGPAINGERDE